MAVLNVDATHALDFYGGVATGFCDDKAKSDKAVAFSLSESVANTELFVLNNFTQLSPIENCGKS